MGLVQKTTRSRRLSVSIQVSDRFNYGHCRRPGRTPDPWDVSWSWMQSRRNTFPYGSVFFFPFSLCRFG